MEKVLIVGAGFMGSGIAQVSAQAGYQVHLMDIQSCDHGQGAQGYSLVRGEVGGQGPSQGTIREGPCADFTRKRSVECLRSGLGHRSSPGSGGVKAWNFSRTGPDFQAGDPSGHEYLFHPHHPPC